MTQFVKIERKDKIGNELGKTETIIHEKQVSTKSHSSKKGKNAAFTLMESCPYIYSVLDPFQCTGARIPDGSGKTVPFTIVQRDELTVNAQGVAGVVYGHRPRGTVSSPRIPGGTLIPLDLEIDTDTASYEFGYRLGSGAIISNLFNDTDVADTANTISVPNWDSSAATVPTTFSKVRLVSLGLNIQFTGNYTENKGTMVLAFVPYGYSKQKYNGAAESRTDISWVFEMPGMKIIPVNTMSGATCIYMPISSEMFEFTTIADPDGEPLVYEVNDSGAYTTWLAKSACGEIWCIASGCEPEATFQVTSFLNYEGIASKNTFLLQPSGESPDDTTGLGMAMNVFQHTPNVSIGSADVNGSQRGMQGTMYAPELSSFSGMSMIGDTSISVPAHPFTNHSAPLSKHLLGPSSARNGGVLGGPSTTEAPSISREVLKMIGGISPDVKKVTDVVSNFSPLIDAGLEALASFLF